MNQTVVPRYAAASRTLSRRGAGFELFVKDHLLERPVRSGSFLSGQPGVTASPPNGEKLASVLTGRSPALVVFFPFLAATSGGLTCFV